jgi:hypothetical protein
MNIKKMHNLIKKKGSLDRESLAAFWSKLLTKLKQVET